MTPKIITSKLITGQDLAEQLGVCRRTIQRWTKNGTLPKPAYLGRTAYYDPSQIAEYVERQLSEKEEVVK